MKRLWIVVLCFVALPSWAQDIPAYAFKNVILHTADGKVLNNTSIVWRDGSIEAVGSKIKIPFDAKVVMDGGDSLHVYPGFIDGFSEIATPKPKRMDRPKDPGNPGYEAAGVQPERKPVDLIDFKSKSIKTANKLGFTAAAIGLQGNMLPGQMDVFYLGSGDAESNLMADNVALKASFRNANRVYPSTLMGTMLMYRQLWANAEALQIKQTNFAKSPNKFNDPGRDMVLEALYPAISKKHPLYMEVDSRVNMERLIKLKNELGFTAHVVSAKEAYDFVDLLKKNKMSVLVSLDLPDEPEWKSKMEKAKKDTTKVVKPVPADVQEFRDKQMKAYKAYVGNLKTLIDEGLKPGFTSSGMKWKDFSKTVKTLMEYGLTEEELVQVLTINTASFLGMEEMMGDVKKGYLANFSVFSKPMSEKKSKVMYQVVKGEVNEFK